MSSKSIQSNVENSLLAILTVAAHCYPGERLKFAFHKDGELEEDPMIVGDSVAFAIAQELKESFSPDDDALTNLGSALRMLTNISKDIQQTQDGISEHAVDRIIYDFYCWLKEAKRDTVALSLFNSWIDVHPSGVVRELGKKASDLLVLRFPKLASLEPVLLKDTAFETILAEQEQRIAVKFGEPPQAPPEPLPEIPPPPAPDVPPPGKVLPA